MHWVYKYGLLTVWVLMKKLLLVGRLSLVRLNDELAQQMPMPTSMKLLAKLYPTMCSLLPLVIAGAPHQGSAISSLLPSA